VQIPPVGRPVLVDPPQAKRRKVLEAKKAAMRRVERVMSRASCHVAPADARSIGSAVK
jgi:hypothetical protein